MDEDLDLSCTTTASSSPSLSPSYDKSTEVKGVLQVQQGSKLKEIPKENGKAPHVILLYLGPLTSVSMHFDQFFRIQLVN